MPRQEPAKRARNFKEVALGYDLEQALREAERCIQCPKSPCSEGCPVGIDIPGFIKAIRENRLADAMTILKSKNALPGVCGRVCPQEVQCEEKCTLGKKGGTIAIGRLERFLADWEARQKAGPKGGGDPSPGARKIAVVGSGPAGLTVAADLARLGYDVTIFEALHVAGGVLTYGIPEFRLPKSIVQAEVDFVASLGVRIELDSLVGRLITIDELLAGGYEAVFLGTGAGLPMFLNVPGENLNGIYSANEFLTRVNLMKAYLFPEYDTPVQVGKKVAVIGGGNVAMDAARCALRLGADKVTVVYRRTEKEMPARREEVGNAAEEGIHFLFLATPKQFLGNGGWVTQMECYEMELGEPDASGRRRPQIKAGSEFIMEVDEVIVSLGTSPNPLVSQTTPKLQTTRYGTIVANGSTGKTVKDRVWAGGDAVTGSATVISAMGAGKRAATDIDRFLKSGKPPADHEANGRGVQD